MAESLPHRLANSRRTFFGLAVFSSFAALCFGQVGELSDNEGMRSTAVCDGLIDEDNVCGGDCTLGQVGDSCTQNSDCCSDKCRGKAGAKVCR